MPAFAGMTSWLWVAAQPARGLAKGHPFKLVHYRRLPRLSEAAAAV